LDHGRLTTDNRQPATCNERLATSRGPGFLEVAQIF